MGAGDLALSVQDADTCAGCTIVLGDNISSTATLTRKMIPTQQKMYDPSDDPNDFNGSHMVNRKTHGGLTKFFLFPSIPFALNLSVTIKASGATLPLASGNMTHMSAYHPFPLRIEGRQYDACFQIGEFGARNKMRLRPPLEHIVYDFGPLVIGTGVVVLIPLASGANVSGPGAQFVNSFAGLMTGAANGVSIPSLKIADILDVNRPFYTWKNTDGTRVIVMAEPVTISESNLGSIRMSTPATPPADAIREIGTIQYKPVAPPPRPPVRIFQPPVDLSIIGEGKKNVIIDILKSVGYMVAVFFVIWLAIKFAKSDTGKNIIDGIGIGLSRLYRGLGGAAAGAGQGIRSGVGAAGSAIGSAGQGIRSVAARGLGVGSAPLIRRVPTAEEMRARRATRDAAKNGAFQVQNPLLAKPPAKPADNAAAAGVGFLKPAPAVGNVPDRLKVAKKPQDNAFSTQYQNPALTNALARKAAADAAKGAAPAPAPAPATLRPVQNARGPLGRAVRQQRNLGRGQPIGEPALQARGLTGRPGGRRRRRMKTGRRI